MINREEKILIINIGKQYGGAEKLIEELIEYRKNISLVLDSDGEFIKKINRKDFNVIECSTKKKRFIDMIKKIKNYINENNVKIIHSHGLPSTILAMALKKVTDVKVITTIHSDINYDFVGVKKHIYLISEAIILPKVDLLICVSTELKEKLKRRYKNINPIVIHNGVSTFKSSKEKLNNDIVTFLVVGRLTKVKNHRLLIKSIKKLNENIDEEYKVLIIGDGEERDNIINLINENKLEGKVILKGFKDNIREYMRNADALIVTSIMEGIPLVILEAFSAKLLVIASNVGGIKEVIENMKNGILYESNNEEQLSNILSHVIRKDIKANIIIEQAYKDFNNNWTVDVMISKYNDAYNLF